MMRRIGISVAVGALVLAAASPAQSALSRQDQKKAKQVLSGTLYLRFDAPCTQGRHPFGVFYSPLVEVSPTGTNTEATDQVNVGWYHASSTVWAATVNDSFTVEGIEYDSEESSAEIELEGVGASADRHTIIKLINIHTLDDFQKAADLAFSHKPLQDEHPDWPEEIREAIAKRRLLNGMNKRQAFYVVGTPAEVDKRTEGKKQVEIWTLQGQGIEFGFWTVSTGSLGRPPETLRFEDGLLVASAKDTKSGGLDLDNP
jgi:hypothetical protein